MAAGSPRGVGCGGRVGDSVGTGDTVTGAAVVGTGVTGDAVVGAGVVGAGVTGAGVVTVAVVVGGTVCKTSAVPPVEGGKVSPVKFVVMTVGGIEISGAIVVGGTVVSVALVGAGLGAVVPLGSVGTNVLIDSSTSFVVTGLGAGVFGSFGFFVLVTIGL